MRKSKALDQQNTVKESAETVVMNTNVQISVQLKEYNVMRARSWTILLKSVVKSKILDQMTVTFLLSVRWFTQLILVSQVYLSLKLRRVVFQRRFLARVKSVYHPLIRQFKIHLVSSPNVKEPLISRPV